MLATHTSVIDQQILVAIATHHKQTKRINLFIGDKVALSQIIVIRSAIHSFVQSFVHFYGFFNIFSTFSERYIFN